MFKYFLYFLDGNIQIVYILNKIAFYILILWTRGQHVFL